MKIKRRFDALNKPTKILICFVIIIILASLLFSMGNGIGETLYKALHR